MECFEQKGFTVDKLETLLKQYYDIDTGYSKQYVEKGYLIFNVSFQMTELSMADIRDIQKIIKPYKFLKMANGNEYFIKTWWFTKA